MTDHHGLHGLGRIPHPETPRAAALYPVTAHPLYATTTATRRNWRQVIYLDQGQTGTCVANALGHRRGDYPTPEPEIDEVWARELYVAATGDTGLQDGTSALAVCRVLAARNEISAYHWVTTPDELKNTILVAGSVAIGIDWYSSFDDPIARYGSSYIDWVPASGIRGGHEVLLDGVNLTPYYGPPYYWLKNSWGTWYGHNGRVRVACSAIDTLVFSDGGDAVLPTEILAA